MRTALITGASRGLGRATAEQLARAGFHTIIAAREEADAAAVADSLTRQGLAAGSVQLDVTDPESVTAAASAVAREHDSLDALVNNAGILPEATMEITETISGEAFRTTLDTNVIGAARVTEVFLPLLRQSPAGRIVNVSSRMGSLADQVDAESPFHATVVPAYQSSKAALNSLTIGLAKALSTTSIVVTSVCPGFVRTGLTPMNKEHAPLDPDQAAGVVVRAATLPPGSESGTFVDAQGSVPW